jgi:hypothetical protein
VAALGTFEAAAVLLAALLAMVLTIVSCSPSPPRLGTELIRRRLHRTGGRLMDTTTVLCRCLARADEYVLPDLRLLLTDLFCLESLEHAAMTASAAAHLLTTA